MLSESDLGPADEALLDMLQQGRITAPFASEETGYSLQYMRDRLGRLVEHGNACKVYEGLYELVDDPREQDVTTASEVPEEAMAGGPTDKGMDIQETIEAADRHMEEIADTSGDAESDDNF